MKTSNKSEKIRLHKDEVHFWNIDFDSAPPSMLLLPFSQIFSADEVQYAAYCVESRKREFLISRFSLRILLTDYFPDVPAQDWKFGTTSLGKPLVIGPIDISPVQFNVSHSNNRAIIAFSLTKALGVDVEHVRKIKAVQLVSESYFSTEEIVTMTKADPQEVHHVFFNYWTLKESFSKALGEGLSFPLDKVTFNVAKPSDIEKLSCITVDLADLRQTADGFWTFKLLNPVPEYQVAFAVLSDSNRVVRIIEAGTFSDWNSVIDMNKSAS